MYVIIFYLYNLLNLVFKLINICCKVLLKMITSKLQILNLKMMFNLGSEVQKQDLTEKSNFFFTSG